jgi:GNAT superfamily N-acetyltransferase
MLQDMAAVGGQPVSQDPQVWTRLESTIRDRIGQEHHLCLLAALPQASAEAIGFVEAQAVDLLPVFVPKRTLHISALYVVERHRGQGIGHALLEAALDWGRHVGCVQAELSVLAENPARALYEQLGFSTYDIEMIRNLT